MNAPPTHQRNDLTVPHILVVGGLTSSALYSPIKTMPETTIPVAERRYELLRDIVLPNRYIRAGAVLTGKEWIELGLVNKNGTPDSTWFADLTPETVTAYSEANKLHAFCQKVFYEEGLRSMAYINVAVRCVQLDRANRAANPNP